MDKVLVMYDLSGKVWNIVYGATEVPAGIPCIWVDMPENAQIESVDPVTKEVKFYYLPETDLGQLQKQMRDLTSKVDQDALKTNSDISNLYNNTGVQRKDITNLQIAITEVYEALLGEEA